MPVFQAKGTTAEIALSGRGRASPAKIRRMIHAAPGDINIRSLMVCSGVKRNGAVFPCLASALKVATN